jgi:hypothetical protein
MPYTTHIHIYTGHTQKSGAVLIVNTIKTAPFFCVCPVYKLQFYLKMYIFSFLPLLPSSFLAYSYCPLKYSAHPVNGQVLLFSNCEKKSFLL